MLLFPHHRASAVHHDADVHPLVQHLQAALRAGQALRQAGPGPLLDRDHRSCAKVGLDCKPPDGVRLQGQLRMGRDTACL